MSDDGHQMILEPVDAWLHPPSNACLTYMAANQLDPGMPVKRAIVTSEFMLWMKERRSDVDNVIQLLFGPFGIVIPTADTSFRVAELQVGDVVMNVEAEYGD